MRNLRLALALVLVAVVTNACTCTMPDCSTFAIVTPEHGATVPAGDVKVAITPVRTTACAFGARGYDIILDDGQPVAIPAGGELSTVFSGVGPGTHVARAVAIGHHGRPMQEARVVFSVPYPAPPPPPPPTPTPAPAAATAAPPAPQVDNMKPVVLEGVPDDVFFDVNKWVIRADQKATVQAWTEYLVKHPAAVVSLQGFYDERGTAAWNKTLAQNRADAVKRQMIADGVSEDRTSTAIYKGEKFAAGSDEAAWRKNRRTHIVVMRQR